MFSAARNARAPASNGATSLQHIPSTRHWTVQRSGAAVLGALLCLSGYAHSAACLQPGQWQRTTEPVQALSQPALLQSLVEKRVVLLGEEHDDAQHHAWQLHTLAALHASRPDMVIGFEGFPRRVQPVLQRWVEGSLGEAEFLRELDWDRIWGLDPKLYLPIFHFARMHRIPLIALNVERALVNRVGRAGWATIPAAEREGIDDPAPASEAYRNRLHTAYRAHAHAAPGSAMDDPAFHHFVDSMLVWDRAMAQALAEALKDGTSATLAVGIVGRGHLEYSHGIPHQLRALGIEDTAVLLPWELTEACTTPPAGIAHAVFGLRDNAMQASGPRLGVELTGEPSGAGARIHRVAPDSVAAAAGLRDGDLIQQVASVAVTGVDTVIGAVRRQAPGTWLPLSVLRDGQTLEVVAKFPPAP